MGTIKYNIGDIFITKEGYEVKIIEHLIVNKKLNIKLNFWITLGMKK